MSRKILLAAFAAALFAVPAYAQNPDAPLKGRDTDPALPPSTQTPPDRVRPSADAPPKDQSLSDKLQKNDGVIKPPETGTTGTVMKPDETGSTPVIKPQETARPRSRHRGEITGRRDRAGRHAAALLDFVARIAETAHDVRSPRRGRLRPGSRRG